MNPWQREVSLHVVHANILLPLIKICMKQLCDDDQMLKILEPAREAHDPGHAAWILGADVRELMFRE